MPPADSAAASSMRSPRGCVRLELTDLERRFGRRIVFAGVNARIETGEVLAISGRNGSGKSTLVKVIAGLLSPTRGRAVFEAGGAPLDGFARRAHIGYVAPDFALYARLTGIENLRFLASLHGVRAASYEMLLERVGLGGRGVDPVGAYSSGMRQRLKYAAALLHQPRVLLLDEPTANLDADGAEMVRGVIAAQREFGVTVVATNEASEVSWGDRVVRLGD